MKKAIIVTAVAVSCGVGAVQAGEQSVFELGGIDQRNHLIYVGIGYGPTTLTTSGNQREVSGIDFTFDTEANDLGSMFYVGGWISEHVGLEIGTRDYGTIDVPFAFSNPRESTSGTGESEVSMDGVNVSLLLGFDITENIQVVGRVGALTWKEKFESRFDVPGQPAVYRDLESSGTGPALGLGVAYRFTEAWQIEGRYEFATLDDDDVSLMTVGLAYDFIGLYR